MNAKVSKSEIYGSVQLPPSKSVAHRMMICAALAGGRLEVENGGKDVEATSRCLDGIFGCTNQNEVPVLNAGESGSTLRFLLPIVCALGSDAVFIGEGRLKDRPLGGLVDCLIAHGARFEKLTNEGLPLKVSGKLCAGKYEIDGSVSSQYVTGLLFALPLIVGDSTIEIKGGLVSSNYVDITLGVLADFGIQIQKTANGFFVAGGQHYIMPNDLCVEGDWSSAGFMLALGLLTGEVRLKGLTQNSLQGDKVVVELMQKAGADIEYADGMYIAKKSKLCAIDFDAVDCPDAVPIMSTVLSFADGVSNINHVDRLRDKESDRLDAVRKMLADFGIKTDYANDTLSVYGGKHKPCVTDSFNDHRMAMSAVVCALSTEGDSTVYGVECMKKSYPNFIEHAVALGAKIQTE